VGSGRRKTFADGEQMLSARMSQNAFVSWVIRESPWELEHELITTIDLPLNLDGNIAHRFHRELTQARARCVAQANALPVVPNTGRGASNPRRRTRQPMMRAPQLCITPLRPSG
jgi:hypothetical protein